jgi:putative ABC transport system permease protein
MNTIILGSALLALIVGLFSIVNTMVMSISERTKEIGIKKAIGASPFSIALEYTLEAGIIGLIGGAIGMGLGVFTATMINNKMASKGADIFLIQSNFLIAVLVFSFVVGILAGIIPAIRASKLNVVDAVREL